MVETKQIDFSNHPGQLAAWNAKKRFVFFIAGVQSGKTTFGAVWIINEAQKRGKGQYLIVAPTYKILEQSTLIKFKELVPKGWGWFNKADSTFTTKDEKTFFLRSADKPESIEGITAKAIWADEASLMKAGAWLMMQGRVSKTLGRILITTTPISLNWIHKEIEKDKERARKTGMSDIDFIQFRSMDSPYFPAEEYERARRMLTEIQFRLRYEGVFGKAEGLIYPEFNNNVHTVDDFEIPAEWRRAGGIDWGYNNPFGALDGAISPDDVLYVYKERYASRKLIKEHVPYLDRSIPYYYDPSGLQEAKELKEHDLDLIPGNNNVVAGIQKVTARIKPQTEDPRSVRLKVFKSCIHLIDEFALYRYKKGRDKEILREEPEKKDDHLMDTLRYLIVGLDGISPGEFHVLEDESIASAISGDNWERKLIEHRQKQEGEKPVVITDQKRQIEVLHRPDVARAYLRGMAEHGDIDRIAKELGVNVAIFRLFIQQNRDWISNIGRGIDYRHKIDVL